MKLLFFTFFILFGTPYMFAQESENDKEAFSHNQIGLQLAHTYMKQGDINTSNNILISPSFTLFYNYRLNEKWSIGLHTDFVIEEFVAEPLSGGDKIERKKPIAPALMLGLKTGKHFSFLLGGGIDTDKEETLGLIRLDTEYGLEIKNGWEFLATLGYDFRFNAYDSFQLGVGLSKDF